MGFPKEKEVLEGLKTKGCVIEEKPTNEARRIFTLGELWMERIFPDLWYMLDYVGIIRCDDCEGEPYKNMYGIHQEFMHGEDSYHVILFDVCAFERGETQYERIALATEVFLHELAHFASWEHNEKFFEYLDYLIRKFNDETNIKVENTYNTDGM